MRGNWKIRIVSTSILLVVLYGHLSAQSGESGERFRRSSVMKGNLVKTVFGNWGVIGQPQAKGRRGAWIYEDNGYVGDVSPLVGAEVVMGDTVVFHSVVVCPVARPTSQQEISDAGEAWGFEPVAGYFNETQEGIALYSDPKSWPPKWPDKLDDPEDEGWEGSWNGYFGKTTTASEECFFVMDDNKDEEFNYPENNDWRVAFKPDSDDLTRNGLGLEVKVRGMQWKDFLAQDCIFWLYEITNTSTTDYSKVVFGMLVGTYVGCTSTDDSPGEYDDDYSFFDVERDLTYTADFDDNCSRNPRWTGEVGVVGYAFLESPGNPFDGIDNDGDADENPLFAATGPFFEESDFDPRLINPGDQIVLIDDDYERWVVTVPSYDTTFITRGAEIFVSPGVTKLVEGNVIFTGVEEINQNAYDGVDNDLDGLIDENFYLHYHQIRKDQHGNILIDRLTPVRHKDYISGLGVDDYLIDEARDDGIDNDDDWNPEFDDVGADGLVGTGDFGEGDGVETPGEPNFDQTDVEESDQIGLTSFEYFAPAGQFAMGDDEEMWERLAPGFFEVPTSIINNKPERGEDGDFIYGSGYFPLRAGQTERFSLALIYGEGGGSEVDIDDLLKNRVTVQKIYNSDYRFPPPPDRPTLTAIPGDGKVTLSWDRKAELSLDPVLKVYDFEGYRIYKATDQNFIDAFIVTDADGRKTGYEKIAQFDLKNGIKGYFQAGPDLYQDTGGYTYWLGDDSGLQHTYVDEDVENGRRYFYAVVAYDRGNAEDDIFPSENDFRIDIEPSGEVVTFQNTAVAVPRAEVIGYVPPEGSVELEHTSVVGTGTVYYNVIHESELTGHTYRVEFFDTATDGLDNDDDWDVETDDVGADGLIGTDDSGEGNGKPDSGEPNVDANDVEELLTRKTTLYSVRDTTGITETFFPDDTSFVRLQNTHLVDGTITVGDKKGNMVSEENYVVDVERGRIKGKEHGDFPTYSLETTYTISYQYYPVYRSPHIQGSPYAAETFDADVFDGITLYFDNHETLKLIDSLSGWRDSTAYPFNFVTMVPTLIGSEIIEGIPYYSDFEILFFDEIVDTSSPAFGAPTVPVNFKILDLTKSVTDSVYIDFIFEDEPPRQQLSPKDDLVFLIPGPRDSLILTWLLSIYNPPIDTVYSLCGKDSCGTYALTLKNTMPFRREDVFVFTTKTPTWDKQTAQSSLDEIRVVPNPYVVATAHERPLPPGVTSGRGERRIEFRHLPPGAKIYIFTSRGEHVITLHHDGDIHDGMVAWNLKTKENLDIAYGIYFYVVESSVGNKKGKIAIIK